MKFAVNIFGIVFLMMAHAEIYGFHPGFHWSMYLALGALGCCHFRINWG